MPFARTTVSEWNQTITTCNSNENYNKSTFEDYVHVEDDVLVSEDLTDDGVVSECSDFLWRYQKRY